MLFVNALDGNKMKLPIMLPYVMILTCALSSCASVSIDKNSSPKSYLAQNTKEIINTSSDDRIEGAGKAPLTKNSQETSSHVSYLPPLNSSVISTEVKEDLASKFEENDIVKLTADELSLENYIHYVFGEILKVSYILGDQIKSDKAPVTLNLQQSVSKRKLFMLTEQILSERGYIIRFEDGIYYIHKAEGARDRGDLVYGYGKRIEDVPNTSLNIVQLVPFDFGLQTSFANTLRQIVKINATPDFERSAIILQGKRDEIIKALEFIQLMDQPAFKNRHIGVFKSTYIPVDELSDKLTLLLQQEGISVNQPKQVEKAVSIIELGRIATLVVFTNSKILVDRIDFWIKQLDQPPQNNEAQYFIYQPKFARATDLGESLNVLINGGLNQINSSTSAATENKASNNKAAASKKISSSMNQSMQLVVDERANSLIFNTTGDQYRQLLPLIKRLDVMPKQVILEVMIAEVKLTDSFQRGVDFVLTNQGTATKSGGFTLESNQTGLQYILTGTKGNITVNLLETNDNVNVLSRPSLLVRDGVTASITIGDDVPTVGEIVSDPVNGSRSSVNYRKTGVELKVKPTINARGTIIMEIDQKISDQADSNESVGGSPIFFERSINTEVVAQSGQTIVLGGLISNKKTVNERNVPFFSSIPLIGGLFEGTSNSKVKTELVVLVTPRIIESSDEWQEIKAKFSSTLSEITIEQ
jgi:general secretion pathway protein D